MTAGTKPTGAAGDCRTLDAVRWLLGEWVSHREHRITTETWTEVSIHTFEGVVTSLLAGTGEIAPVETLRLVAMSGGVFYMAKVPEHALPIAFEMTTCDERTAIFENPGHDFPRVIAYELVADGLLSVAVTDGTDEGFTLRYTRASGPPVQP